ncbi:hypothetical protein FH972_005759 [Carpinus fangiana]|uniref:Uncharacterized protein n=1 Tax=Carpinus fangiana TaxID=176857 RepID=A0A5N6QQL3_9ROSI|nr:hypothetical protein FH972_005759 [Carpinus fangiana]
MQIVLDKAEEARIVAFSVFKSLGFDVPYFSQPISLTVIEDMNATVTSSAELNATIANAKSVDMTCAIQLQRLGDGIEYLDRREEYRETVKAPPRRLKAETGHKGLFVNFYREVGDNLMQLIRALKRGKYVREFGSNVNSQPLHSQFEGMSVLGMNTEEEAFKTFLDAFPIGAEQTAQIPKTNSVVNELEEILNQQTKAKATHVVVCPFQKEDLLVEAHIDSILEKGVDCSSEAQQVDEDRSLSKKSFTKPILGVVPPGKNNLT